MARKRPLAVNSVGARQQRLNLETGQPFCHYKCTIVLQLSLNVTTTKEKQKKKTEKRKQKQKQPKHRPSRAVQIFQHIYPILVR